MSRAQFFYELAKLLERYDAELVAVEEFHPDTPKWEVGEPKIAVDVGDEYCGYKSSISAKTARDIALKLFKHPEG